MRALTIGNATRGIILMATCAVGIARAQQRPRTAAKDASSACNTHLGPSPFKDSLATRIVVANFYGVKKGDQQFGDDVAAQVDAEMTRFKEEVLGNPKEFDIPVSTDGIEIARLGCFVKSHEEARQVAEAWDADLVIWGKAYCNAGSVLHVTNRVDKVVTRPGAVVNIGTVTYKPYSVCPSATLHRREAEARRTTSRAVEMDSLADLSLPTLSSTEPFQLVYFTLGMHFLARKNWWLAARFFKRSADSVLADMQEAAPLYLYLARAYTDLPDLEKALEYGRRALREVEGTGTRAEGMALISIGATLVRKGQFAEAEAIFRKALPIVEKTLGTDHVSVGICTLNLGAALRELGRLADAEAMFRRALSILESRQGPENPDVAHGLSNLGVVLTQEGRFAEAEAAFRRAIGIFEKAFGPEHPNVAFCTNNLAMVLQGEGRFAEAEVLWRKTLPSFEKTMGQDHPDVASCMNNLGMSLLQQDRFGEAEAMFRRALAISEKKLGADHPHTAEFMSNVAEALREQSHFKEAEVLFRKALALLERRLGPDHPDVGVCLNGLGEDVYRQGRYNEAAELLGRALGIFEKSLGAEHPGTAHCRASLATALRDSGQFEKAEAMHLRALESMRRTLGPDHPEVRKVAVFLAMDQASRSGWKQDGSTGGAAVLGCGVSSPACMAGVKPGDWIRSYGESDVRSAKQLLQLVDNNRSSAPIRIGLVRGGKPMQIEVRAGALGLDLDAAVAPSPPSTPPSDR